MGHRQRHRGPHPRDEALFAPKWHEALCRAVADMSWLLDRGYAETAALKLVGDHLQLTTRQRRAVRRASCSTPQLARRQSHRVSSAVAAGRVLDLDGYNQLITVESMLAGGQLFRGRDGCIRDLASVHGSYRRVTETNVAIDLLGTVIAAIAPVEVRLYFDQPISNSGRLSNHLQTIATERGWPWQVFVVRDPDAVLKRSKNIVVSSDSVILDQAQRWFDLLTVVAKALPSPCTILDLSHHLPRNDEEPSSVDACNDTDEKREE